MARRMFTAAEAAEMVLGQEDEYVSSPEPSEIDEDEEFPLPMSESDKEQLVNPLTLPGCSHSPAWTPLNSPSGSHPFSPSSGGLPSGSPGRTPSAPWQPEITPSPRETPSPESSVSPSFSSPETPGAPGPSISTHGNRGTAGGRGRVRGTAGGRGRGRGTAGGRGRGRGTAGGGGRGRGTAGGRGRGQGTAGGGGRGRGTAGGGGCGRGTAGGRGRGRGTARGRGRGASSSLPWRPVDPDGDTLPSPFTFTEDVGSMLQMPPGSEPIDYYRQLVDDRVIHLIVEETNRYARERIESLRSQNLLRPRSRFATWQPLTTTELEGFFAIILNMGIIQLPEVEDYWRTSWSSEIPFFTSVLRRDRFEQIFWLLHVSHVEEGQPARRIDKVKALIDILIPNFQSSYKPSRDIAVDETMVGFRGRFGPKQYMPNKPVKYGIKAFTMADSENAYLLDVLVYTGSNTLQQTSTQYADLPQPARVVLHLIGSYLDKGHHVFTDRYYTSIPLAQALAARSTAFTGTVMRNRVELPDSIRYPPSRLADDEVKAFRVDRLLAIEWRAAKKKKSLLMISSESSANMVQVVSRRTQQEVQKPFVVDHYNHSMNGVDRADQYTVYYSFIRRARKWWRKLFFWLMEVAVVNSYILYKLNTPKAITHLDYRRKVAEALASRHIQSAPPRSLPGRPRKRQCSDTTGDPERLNGHSHFPGKLRQPKECVVCSDPARGQRHRSLHYCTTCTSQPTLCIDTCFKRYHTQELFRIHYLV